jgi:hypothetical protein
MIRVTLRKLSFMPGGLGCADRQTRGVFHPGSGRAAPRCPYDAIEALRPYIEAWLLCGLAEVRFAKRDFYKKGDGITGITRPHTSWSRSRRLYGVPPRRLQPGG